IMRSGRSPSPWACATSRHEITHPPKMPTKFRRLMSPPALRSAYRSDQTWVAGRGKRLVSAAVAPAPHADINKHNCRRLPGRLVEGEENREIGFFRLVRIQPDTTRIF